MRLLQLHEFHLNRSASFLEVRGNEVVDHYQNVLEEYKALGQTAGVIDLSFRGRVCLTGPDRKRFLNGQVTNDVGALNSGSGCYAALVTAKGKMVSDLNIYSLENELLLDFEPGYSASVTERIEKYVIADDVQVVNVANDYGLWSIQGPHAPSIIRGLNLGIESRETEFEFSSVHHAVIGELYLVTQRRFTEIGYDLYVPVSSVDAMAQRIEKEVSAVGATFCGWQALEMRRIEAGVPRFGLDMDEANLPPEAGLESRAISYSKGCYTGQEVLARIRTYGKIAKLLRGLKIEDPSAKLPVFGDKLFHSGKEVGSITSALESPAIAAKIALGYVRREHNMIGTELTVRTGNIEMPIKIVELPFFQP